MFCEENKESEVVDELFVLIGNRNAKKVHKQKRQMYESMEYGLDMWKDYDKHRIHK